MCREKSQRGSLKKLQAHRKQRSTHCENILYQGAGEQRRRCWLDGSGGQRENDTSRHNIYKYVVKYCPGVVSLWDVGLRDNPARCAVLINKFQYFDFWSLLLFLNTQDNLKSNSTYRFFFFYWWSEMVKYSHISIYDGDWSWQEH